MPAIWWKKHADCNCYLCYIDDVLHIQIVPLPSQCSEKMYLIKYLTPTPQTYIKISPSLDQMQDLAVELLFKHRLPDEFLDNFFPQIV